MKYVIVQLGIVALAFAILYGFGAQKQSNIQVDDAVQESNSEYVKSLRFAACDQVHEFTKKGDHCFGYVAPNTDNCRIGSGFAADLDYKIRAEDLFPLLTAPSQAVHHEGLKTENDVLETMAYHFQLGAAGEYRVEDVKIWQKLLSKVETIPYYIDYTAGSSMVMAKRISEIGCTTYFIMPLVEEQFDLVPSKDSVLNSAEKDFDIHLIIEYSEGMEWGNFTTVRDNRFYLNHDIVNFKLDLLETAETEKLKNSDVFALGGIQLLQGIEGYQSTVDRIKVFLEKIDVKHIHFEFANFYDNAFFDYFYEQTWSFYDSLGINEQEISNLVHYIKTGDLEDPGDSKPSITKSISVINELLDLSKGRLSRIHFHSIFVHSICSNKQWQDPTVALAKSVLMAGARACNVTDIQSNKIVIKDDEAFYIDGSSEEYRFTKDDPIVYWKKGEYQCAIAPVPVCRHALRTAGLGDNISGTGLAYHRINN